MTELAVERDPTLDRVESFSTAVFAIAITLNAFTLVVPELTGSVSANRLWRALGDDWPRLFSYVLSFVLIAQIWINYQRMLKAIHRSDHWLLWLNMLLLLGVSAYTVPTRLLGEYALKPGAQTVAALIYGGWLTLNGLFYNAIWWRALAANLVHPHLDPVQSRRLAIFWSLGVAANVPVTLIALLNVWVSLVGFAVLALFYILPPPRLQRAQAHESQAMAQAEPRENLKLKT